MKASFNAEVSEVRKVYGGYPDYKEGYKSTLTIIKNELDVTGSIYLPEKLDVGVIYRVSVDTNIPRSTIVSATDADFCLLYTSPSPRDA